MTEEQYNAMVERVDAIADAVTARVAASDSWALTEEEIAVLVDAPGIEEAGAILDKYTAGPIDFRRDMVMKGYAQALLAMPSIIKAIHIGYDGGADA